MASDGPPQPRPLSPLSPHNVDYDSLEEWLGQAPAVILPPIPPISPEPILPFHTLQNIAYPLQPRQPAIVQHEHNTKEPREAKRRKLASPQLPASIPIMPQFNPALTLELVHYPPNTIPTVPVAHTVNVAIIEVRVKGHDPMLEQHPYSNEFIILSKFFQGGNRLKIPGDGLAVSTFHMTKDTGGVNRNAFWSKETRIAKFCMKTLFSPRNDEERRLSVKFQLCHQHGPGRFTAITSWVHLVDLYICPANCRLTKSKKAYLTGMPTPTLNVTQNLWHVALDLDRASFCTLIKK